MPRPDGRAADELRVDHLRARLHRDDRGLGAGHLRPDPRAVHRLDRRGRASLDAGHAARAGSRRSTRCCPGSSPERVRREARDGASRAGRTQEIQRLIGRSLRAVCDMRALGERQVLVDCDVLQADGGTRTASICGGYLALHDALTPARASGWHRGAPAHRAHCAAISVGIVGGVPDARPRPTSRTSTAEVDMNVVMTSEGRFVEVQGTAEGMAFTRGRARRPAGPGRGRDRRDRRAAGRVRRRSAAARPSRRR